MVNGVVKDFRAAKMKQRSVAGVLVKAAAFISLLGRKALLYLTGLLQEKASRNEGRNMIQFGADAIPDETTGGTS